jgi:TolB-like protein/DNA-binding winged helix-turn-helix (wHTH) protein/Flp pilus assembly protein TadD
MDEPAAHLVYEFADFRVDTRQRLLLLKSSGRPLPLSSRAFDALVYFLEHRGQLLEKGALMAAIWPKVVVEENNLTQHISALRRLLGESRDDHRFIVTVPGRGYRFVADVMVRDLSRPEAERLPESTPRLPPSAPSAPEAKATTATHHVASPRARLAYWIGGAVAALVLGAALIWSLRVRRPDSAPTGQSVVTTVTALPPAASVARGSSRLRLAILPFENLSPEPENAFFTDGMHEELISTLAERLRGVDVISRTTMTSARLKAQPVTVVASTLGATHIIEGSVRREGKHVRVTLQLIDAGTDQHVWSKNYDRTLESALTLQSEVASEVASQLSLQLADSAPSAGPPTQDAEAYDQYLKAVVALRIMGGDTPLDQFRTVDELLGRAIERDPRFALAYAQRARLATLSFILFGTDPERIRDDVARAKSLAPREPAVLGAEGYYLYAMGENERALASLNAAEALGLTDPVWLIPKTRVLMKTGRIEEAVRTHQHMLELDPADPSVITFAADHFILLRRPADALRVVQLLETQYPDLYRWYRCRTLLDFAGRTQDFREAMEQWSTGRTPAQWAAFAPGMRDWFDLLRYEHRYRELDQLVQRVPPGIFSTEYIEVYDRNLGKAPAGQEMGGWTALLLGDASRAARAGESLLAYVKSQTATPRIAFFLHRLEAEGHVFAAQPAAAIHSASASLQLVPREKDAVAWVGVAMITARVYAWAGAKDQAVALLEQLATATPGLPPAYIARDPLLVMPLATDPQYQALAGRLEAQMTALSLN